ncbi:hypothetical protein HYH03_016559 [Edaphochlamys debaryana]|uniref:Uncharacterized protein n=1 Tax=Edaphochlamys debaryana TaxID=47281 RepID=A0A835XK54_9CHLO|nr:hypothetical protein HYH03_016559 [Edaphochlamys debaryana]|eukprot:KAG2484672.1 hypothetical protein HYH03_016559 [Edaphochlamys debaryana]
MVTDGISLLVDHLEHFHYKAKAVALEGLLALSGVGLGPDRRLDPGGAALMAAGAGGTAAAGSLSASSAALLAAAAGGVCQGASGDEGIGAGGGGSDPKQVADAVTALGGLGLGDWLALRIVGAGALPRLLELLTHRTGVNFVQHRHVASQVVHNLARRRCAAVRAALARWRPLPGLISSLDVVLEDNPDIAARLLLALGDLLPTTSHQIAGVLHKLIAKHAAAQQPAPQPPTQMGAAKSGDGPFEAASGALQPVKQCHGKGPSEAPLVAEAVKVTVGEGPPAAMVPEPAHLGLAPDVDVPLEQLLLRVCGYYMRLCFNAVFAPAALPQLPAFRPPASEADKREYEKAYARFKLEDYRRRRKESGQLDCCVAALLAAAPMPSALFESMSYSYQRALAVLAGPPPGSALTATTSGGLWRAQDLLPYALAVLQSLGGGSDTGDGCGGSGVLPVADAGGGAGLLADFLAGTSLGTAAGGSNSSDGAAAMGGLCSSMTSAAVAAFDWTWGLEHPRQAVLGGLGPAGAAAVLDGCQGPSLPGAPYGNRPVSDAVLERYGAVIQSVLERAVQAADGLPAAAAATATALASAASGSNGSAVTLLRQAAAEAPPLAVLRAVGSTLESVTRAQVAERIASRKDYLVRLAASLSSHTGSTAASAAQARAALGLANIWSCLHAVSATARRRWQVQRQQQVAETVVQPVAVMGGASEAAELAPESAAPPPVPVVRRGRQAATTYQAPVRRSSRIKRRRDGGSMQEEEATLRPAVPGAEGPSSPEPSCEGEPVSRVMQRQPEQADEQLQDPEGVRGQAELLSAIVTLLASRFAEARVVAEGTSGQEREGEASTAASAAAPAAVAPVPWQADRGRQAGEVQALLLQATALLLPGLDAAAARRLVDSGAALCAARVVRAALTVPAGAAAALTAPAPAPAAPANAGPLGFGAAAGHPPTPPQLPTDLESVAAAFGEPQNGLSGAQALGLLVELLRVASAGGGGGFAAAGLHNPEVVAALGGALLLAKRGPALARATTSAPGGAPSGSSAHASVSCENGDLVSEPSASCWDLLRRLTSGSRHSAGHDLLLQLLPPLLALTHGPSPRCAAARARLLPVLTSVAGRWSHSRLQRRRLVAQALTLWGPTVQQQLTSLPREDPQPSPAGPDSTAPTAAGSVGRKATGKAGGGAAGKAQSQSTLPYPLIGNRGSARAPAVGTPTTAALAPRAAGTGSAHRTPQRSSTPAAELPPRTAASSKAMLAPTAASGATQARGIPQRTRPATRCLAPELASPPSQASAAPPSHCPGPKPGVGAPLVDASSGQPLVAPAAVELVRTTMERLGDAELVRILHTTGWLRALCHGARCADPGIRGSCVATLQASARRLVDAAVGAASTTTAPSAPADNPPSASELPLSLHLVVSDIAAEATVSDMLLSIEPAVATLLRPVQSAAAAALGQLPEDRAVTFHGLACPSGPRAGETELEPVPPLRRSSRRRAAAAAAAALASAAPVPPPSKGRRAGAAFTAKRASGANGTASAADTATVAAAALSAGPSALPSSIKRRRLANEEDGTRDTAPVWQEDGADALGPAGTANTAGIAAAAEAVSPSHNAPLQLQLSVREAGLAAAMRRSCMMLEAALASRRYELAAVRASDQASAAAAAAAATIAVAAGAPVTRAAPSPRPLSPKRTTRSRAGGGQVGAPDTTAPVTAALAAGAATAAAPARQLVGDEEFLARTYRSVSKQLNFDDL